MNTGGPASEKTLLDEFAGQALQGLLACPVGSGRAVENAASAYDHASAMLAEKARREGVSEIAPKDSDNRVIRVGWSLFSIADEALDSNDESRCFLHDWKEAVKDHREVVVQQSSTTQAREVDDDYWAKFQDGIRIVFQPTNGWCAEIRDGSMGYGNTIAEAVANLRARWEERDSASVVQESPTTDHSPDATKMIAIESANRELVEALGWVSKTIATTDDHKSKVAMTVILREVDAIIAKHKGAK